MQKISLLSISLLFLLACKQKTTPVTTHTDTIIAAKDTVLAIPIADTAVAPPHTDTIVVTEPQLLGRWTRPVEGLENKTEGFELRKQGKIRNINSTKFTMVYDGWALHTDTLILSSHQALVKEPEEVIDTAIIRGITDTTLILFPIRAAEGYEERYTRRYEMHRK